MNDHDMDELFAGGDGPGDAAVKGIGARLQADLKPVRPLPSNAVLWCVSFGIFAVFSFAAAKLEGMRALAALSGGEMAVYYGAVLVFAAIFARAVTERMIPGAKRMVPFAGLALLALPSLALVAFEIFGDRSTDSFAARGLPCFELGSLSALASGALGWRLLRRGYLVSPRETLALYGFFAGLAGVGVLALHCPIRNSLHFLVWHLGAMLLAGFAGFLLGEYADR